MTTSTAARRPRMAGAVVSFAVLAMSVTLMTGSAANLIVDGGILQVLTISDRPDVGPPVPEACAHLSFAEVIVGTDGDDIIDAANGGALVVGMGGDDVISGGNGKDCLVGGQGDDILSGGNGADVLLGGDGDDVIDGGNGPDVIDGGNGHDLCMGLNGPDVEIDCESSSAEADPTVTVPSVDAERPTRTDDAGPNDAPQPTPDPRAGRQSLLVPCKGGADCVVYVVREGDNLFSIVRYFEVSLAETLELNPWLAEADHLPIGVELRLPWPHWMPGRPGEEDPPAAAPATPAPPSTRTPDPVPSPSPAPTDPAPNPTPDPEPVAPPEPPPDGSPEPSSEPPADPATEPTAAPSTPDPAEVPPSP